jgi:hypothetical protein
MKSFRMTGEPGGARTRDHRIKSAMLYQLSYRLSGITGARRHWPCEAKRPLGSLGSLDSD